MFCGNCPEQVVGQVIPAGLLATVPVPAPANVTVSETGAAKVAVTELVAVTATVQLVVPVHAPPQPEKVLFAPGVSLSVTWVFCAKVAEHVEGQLIPGGLLMTVPVPDPAIVTVIAGTGGVVDPPPPLPPQPAKTRLAKADNDVNQNVCRGFMGVPLLKRVRLWMKSSRGWLFLGKAGVDGGLRE